MTTILSPLNVLAFEDIQHLTDPQRTFLALMVKATIGRAASRDTLDADAAISELWPDYDAESRSYLIQQSRQAAAMYLGGSVLLSMLHAPGKEGKPWTAAQRRQLGDVVTVMVQGRDMLRQAARLSHIGPGATT